jgi:hypothetical protein
MHLEPAHMHVEGDAALVAGDHLHHRRLAHDHRAGARQVVRHLSIMSTTARQPTSSS